MLASQSEAEKAVEKAPSTSAKVKQTVMEWTPPRRPWCARVVVLETTEQEASVAEASTIGLDLAKRVFQAHGADASGAVVFRKRLRRGGGVGAQEGRRRV